MALKDSGLDDGNVLPLPLASDDSSSDDSDNGFTYCWDMTDNHCSLVRMAHEIPTIIDQQASKSKSSSDVACNPSGVDTCTGSGTTNHMFINIGYFTNLKIFSGLYIKFTNGKCIPINGFVTCCLSVKPKKQCTLNLKYVPC